MLMLIGEGARMFALEQGLESVLLNRYFDSVVKT
jgi:hypothetical protein